MPVLHTASFEVLGSKLCVGRDVKLWKNTTWPNLGQGHISLTKGHRNLKFSDDLEKSQECSYTKKKSARYLKRFGVQVRKTTWGGNPTAGASKGEMHVHITTSEGVMFKYTNEQISGPYYNKRIIC